MRKRLRKATISKNARSGARNPCQKSTAVLARIVGHYETVVPGFHVLAWGGVVAPAGTPREIVTLLGEELRKFTERTDIKEKLHAMGFEPYYAGAEEFSAFMKSEEVRWTQMAKAAGINPE
jgi:tripartite-type tricarboxylate transporter receptor subunit TctC